MLQAQQLSCQAAGWWAGLHGGQQAAPVSRAIAPQTPTRLLWNRNIGHPAAQHTVTHFRSFKIFNSRFFYGLILRLVETVWEKG